MSATTYNLDLWYQLKQAVISGIKSLNLDKIGNNVVDQMLRDPTNIALPAVLVEFSEDTEEPMHGDTETTDWWYPVNVWVIARQSVHDTSEQQFILQTRAAIMKSFDQRNLPEQPTSVMYVTPKNVLESIRDQYQALISGMTIRIWASEARVK